MKFEIDLLKNHPDKIPELARIWYEVLGKTWAPEIKPPEMEAWYQQWLNEDIPLAYIVLHEGVPIGSCSLQFNDEIRPDLEPWMGDLIVLPQYQNQGIGKALCNLVKDKAKSIGYKKLHLFILDPTLINYYNKLGWKKIDTDEYIGKPVIVLETTL